MGKDIRFADNFLFTQFSLITFKNCPLKFKKRYMENLKWDTFPDEETKRRVLLGNNFHLLASRYFSGIQLFEEHYIEEFPELGPWIDNLKESFKLNKNYKYLPEYKLRMINASLRLEANFDLLIIKDNSIEIWDWKTRKEEKDNLISTKKTNNRKYQDSLQTIAYMFVLKELANIIINRDIAFSDIKMFYWQPDPPKIVEEIFYNQGMHQNFKNILQSKINDILNYDFSNFDMSLYKKHCKYCEFNWFCNNEKINFDNISDFDTDDFIDNLDLDCINEVF